MPLVKGSKSKKVLSKNIKTEMEKHPDMKPKQAAAIAYAAQKMGKKKK